MGKYDFDKVIDRRGTGAIKTDSLTEFYGRDDLQAMWIADMDFAVAPAIQQALAQRIAHPIYGYPRVKESYWNAVTGWLRRRHGWSVNKEDIIFVPGIVKGIGFVVNHFTRRGDAVLIQPPVYHPFRLVPEGNGRRIVENPLIPTDDGYRMDFEGLERVMAQEKPKLMILCNPHNPVGIQWDERTLQRVASLAFKYGVKVVSDEIHADLMLFGTRHIPFATVSNEAARVAITFGAPSKTFNIAGLVSSWCVINNPEMRDPFFNWMKANEFDAPTFVAMEATECAYTQCEDWLNEMLHYIEDTIVAVEQLVKEEMPKVRVVRPQASFMIWLDCTALGMDHDRLIDLFVNRAHLALNDGAMFGQSGSGFMRLNIGEPRAVVLDALHNLAEAIKGV
ncbi:MAG: pyridoxal phosphate-dependent aminotransferase [Muribaculum sp.]|nr:pyridoxal phosphate-dependent aminotransferase [Muribaculaceae bacterium]MCM1080324.1 pyridoxal phosphate-dependent aminotransferase [Muribaculum sp.]